MTSLLATYVAGPSLMRTTLAFVALLLLKQPMDGSWPAEYLCAGANGEKQFRPITLDVGNTGDADALITS